MSNRDNNRKNDNNVSKFQPQGKVKVLKGSALTPENYGLSLVLSLANMEGKPEGNPMMAEFDKKWRKVREDARSWFVNKTGAYKLGAINTTAVNSDVWVIHCLCQNKELQYEEKAMETCLKEISKMAKYENASVHIDGKLVNAIPNLQELANTHLIKNGVNVYYYQT